MKIIITEEQLKTIIRERRETHTGKEVAQHIIDITPEEDNIPYFYINKYIIPNDGWAVEKIDLNNLLETDPSFKEYYESGEVRYDDDDVNPDGIDNYLVVYNGELLDGYSRATTKLNNGEAYAYAFVLGG